MGEKGDLIQDPPPNSLNLSSLILFFFVSRETQLKRSKTMPQDKHLVCRVQPHRPGASRNACGIPVMMMV